jgi:hypothetical protein
VLGDVQSMLRDAAILAAGHAGVRRRGFASFSTKQAGRAIKAGLGESLRAEPLLLPARCRCLPCSPALPLYPSASSLPGIRRDCLCYREETSGCS